MTTALLACAILLAAPVERLQLVVVATELEPETVAAVHEELAARLPTLLIIDGGLGAPAGPEGMGYGLELAVPTTGSLSVRLVDPLGNLVLTEGLDRDEEPRQLARRIALLVEGQVRLHEERLARLLELLRPSKPLPAPPAALAASASPAPSRPGIQLGAALVVAADARGERVAPGLRLSTGVTVRRWLAPFVGLSLTWPRAVRRGAFSLALGETSLALGTSVGLVDGGLELRAGLAALLYLISARPRELPHTAEVLTTHGGGRAQLTAVWAMGERLGLTAELTADLIPTYPRHTWRGEMISSSGPWRFGLAFGARFAP